MLIRVVFLVLGGHKCQAAAPDEHGSQYSEIARKFLTHPARRVREWAQYEVERARLEAASFREMDEEFLIE